MDNYQDSRCLALDKALADESVAPIDLPFWFLEAITGNFSDEKRIGGGGFGSVYKGALRNGMVAVKKLHNMMVVEEKDFQREVDCLIDVKHRNIVRFLGYCYETQHKVHEYEGRRVLVDKRNMLFCFEFLSKGSLTKYATDASSGLKWSVRYQIIKGICEGVAHLHQKHIVHMDLKPDNILLDDTMQPKITDFGISRRFGENQSKIITGNIVGSMGYMAPEFSRSGTITLGTDIYSLGVIIIEILTGNRESTNVNKVLESWANTFGTSKSNPPLEQVQLCTEIGIDCMDDDPSKRPNIKDIICRLNETNISVQLDRFYQYCREAKQACKPMRITASMEPELRPCWLNETALLDVHPLELCFPFEAKKVTQCSLNLINRTDRHFAYFIRPQFQDLYTIDLPVSYDLDPMSTVALNVKMVEQELPPLDAGMFEILMISMESKCDIMNLESSVGKDPQKFDNDLLRRVEMLDGEVHAAMLTAVICPPRDDAPKVISRVHFPGCIGAIDMHSTRPWILVGHGRSLSIWRYYDDEAEGAVVFSVNIKDKEGKLHSMMHGHASVTSVRFISRKDWCVAGDESGHIHVYTPYRDTRMKEIKSFKAYDRYVGSLAIHPTFPYLLSAYQYGDSIEIWDWEKGWACSRKVQTGHMTSAMFNPMDANTFITSYDGLKVWSINPSAHQPITTIESEHVVCLTEAAAGRNHVVVLDISGDLHIWDLQTGTRVHTLRRHPRTSFIAAASACHPTHPIVACGTMSNNYGDGPPVICFWNSTNYRLEKTVPHMPDGRSFMYLGFVGSRRLLIGTYGGIEVQEIDMESLACQQ